MNPSLATERARKLAYGLQDWDIVEPRPATTVMLLRDDEAGLHTFLMRRPLSMKFAPGMHVFPGGAIDPEDQLAPHILDPRYPLDAVAARASTTAPMLSAGIAAAIREVHEEAGVNLAAAPLTESSFALIDHWVTPAFETRRFDVSFFVALMPEGQQAHAASAESEFTCWITPAEALQRHQAGDMPMLQPTLASLGMLNQYPTVAAVMDYARTCAVTPRTPMPVPDGRGGVRWQLVHAYTGEVLADDTGAPGDLETEGVRQ